MSRERFYIKGSDKDASNFVLCIYVYAMFFLSSYYEWASLLWIKKIRKYFLYYLLIKKNDNNALKQENKSEPRYVQLLWSNLVQWSNTYAEFSALTSFINCKAQNARGSFKKIIP